MLKNYFKVALRNLYRHKGYAFVNVAGLAIGMTACLLILLYVRDELRYDRFHEHADRIYRVALDAALGGQTFNSATSSAPMAATLRDEFPDVENAGRLWGTGRVLSADSEPRLPIESNCAGCSSGWGSLERALAT